MKRSKKMLVLLAALVVLVGGYYLVTALTKEPDVSTAAEGSYDLCGLTADNLTGLSWMHDGEAVTLQKTQDGWMKTDDAAYPLDQDAAQALADTLLQLKGTRELTGVTTLSDYGLTDESFSVTATTADGTEATLQMGDETPLDEQYYLKVSGKDAVYTVEETLATAFAKGYNELAVKETLPQIGTAHEVTITGTVSQRLDSQSGRWARTGTAELSDTSKVEALVGSIGELSLDTLVTYNADDAALTAYGLDAPTAVTVLYTDADGAEQTFALEIGGADTSGTYCYTRVAGSRMVYLMTADSLTAVLAANDNSLRNLTLSTVTWEELSEMTLRWGNAICVIDHSYEAAAETGAAPTAEAATEAAETPAAAESATVNGKAADPEACKALLTALTGETATGVADSVDEQSEAVLSITLQNLDGTSETLTLHEHDADSYWLESDCERKLLVNADTIDKLIRQAKALAK